MNTIKLIWNVDLRTLTLSRRRPLSYRNQSIDLLCKSMDWFLYDNGPRHEGVNSLIATLFNYSFVWDIYFTAKIFIMHIISIGLIYVWYVSVCRGVFRTQQNICGGASYRKLQESLIVDVRMGSNYTSGITFTVEKVSRMSMFVSFSQRQFCQSHWEIYPWSSAWINKKCVGSRCNLFLGLFLQLNGLTLYCELQIILVVMLLLFSVVFRITFFNFSFSAKKI